MIADWPMELTDLLDARGFVADGTPFHDSFATPDRKQHVTLHRSRKVRKPWRHFWISPDGCYGRLWTFATAGELRDHLIRGDFGPFGE